MQSKEEALKSGFKRSQYNQMRALIVFVLRGDKCALTSKELHVKLRGLGYCKTFAATRKILCEMSNNGEVLVSFGSKRHYFVI